MFVFFFQLLIFLLSNGIQLIFIFLLETLTYFSFILWISLNSPLIFLELFLVRLKRFHVLLERNLKYQLYFFFLFLHAAVLYELFFVFASQFLQTYFSFGAYMFPWFIICYNKPHTLGYPDLMSLNLEICLHE